MTLETKYLDELGSSGLKMGEMNTFVSVVLKDTASRATNGDTTKFRGRLVFILWFQLSVRNHERALGKLKGMDKI